MLTETMSDPRRANWFTITSMSENLCWPEETSTSRPTWELEAEILRLTTRLMMRERELKQVKSQMKSQSTKTQQQVASLQWKMEEKEEQMRLLLLQKDSEMQTITSQLLFFESELRQEQQRIEILLQEKDTEIQKQQEEIQQLRQMLGKNMTVCGQLNEVPYSKCTQSVVSSEDKNCDETMHTDDDSISSVKKLKDGLTRIRAIQDVTNVKSRSDRTLVPEVRCENPIVEKRRLTQKTPQKMKDLKAKRVNSYKSHRHISSEICGQVIL